MIERHYRVAELAELWGFSPCTIRRIFSNEEGVLKLEGTGTGRKYVSLSIPESVALRVHARLGQQPLKASRAGRNPGGVVLLRDLYGGVSKKPRHVVKLKALK